jgi:TRAP-type C4-dicarboxylate transport system substrate-binding protein
MASAPLTRLALVVIACVIALQWTNPAHAHGVTLKIHHFLPADSAFHTRFLLPWKEKLEKESDGHLRIQIYPAMQLGGNPSQLYDQVKDRTVDIVWASVAYDAWRFPAFEVFNLPFMTHSAKGSNRALWEYVQTHNLARKEFAGVRLLAVNVSPAVGSGRQAQGLAEDESALHSDVFIFAMNSDAYKGLPDELRQVIIANSGAGTSAWLGEVLDDSRTSAIKAADGEGGAQAKELALWQRRAQRTIENRIKELDQRGLNGKELVERARALLAEYDPPN